MPSDLHLFALGSVIAVPAQGEVRTRLAGQWSRCLPADGAQPVTTVALSGHADPHQQEYALASAVTRAGIAQLMGRFLMLHACGVCDLRTGRSVILVAPSGTGKTTAAARLCTSRFGYISDETVAFDRARAILPYPKPLSVVMAADRPGHKSQHSPDELGLLPCHERPVASMLVLLCRDGGQTAPRLEPVALLEAVLELIPQTSALPAMPAPLNTLCDHIAAMGGARRLIYADIEEAADLLADALALCAPAEPAHVHLPPARDAEPPAAGPSTGAPQSSAPDTPQAVARAPYSDAVAVDDEVLVLIGNVPVHLTGLGATIWRAAADPATLPTLVGECVVAHGNHPDARELVEAAVATLLAHGLLQAA